MNPRPAYAFLVTCEHGGHRIPARYRACFAGQEALLHGHRGYDPGALTMARDLARRLHAPLLHATVSRLLVDLNRSVGHPHLHAEVIRQLPQAQRQQILARYYLPYRAGAEAVVARAVAQGQRVIHLSSHSFTPVLDGVVRNVDIGLLYDPARPREAALCRAWQASLKRLAPTLRVRRNAPYKGIADGHTAGLRRRFAAEGYVGIELEINQGFFLAGGAPWRRLRALVLEALEAALP